MSQGATSADVSADALPEPLASLLRAGVIVCPRTGSPLTAERVASTGAWLLRSREGAIYAVQDGIPVLTSTAGTPPASENP